MTAPARSARSNSFRQMSMEALLIVSTVPSEYQVHSDIVGYTLHVTIVILEKFFF